MKLTHVLALTIVAATACGDDVDPMTSDGGSGTESGSTTNSTDAATTNDTDGATSVATEAEGSTTVDEGSTTLDESSTAAEESSTGVALLECGWREGSINVALPDGDTFPFAIATCSESGVSLRVLTAGGASCDDPNATPGCDDAYRAIRLTLAPEQLQAGTYDLADVPTSVDLQSGGGAKVECGFIGGGADSGELIISAVSESGVSGYVSAEVILGPDDSEFVSGRFAAPLCPES